MIKDRSWTEINLDNYRNNVAKLKSLIRKDQKIMQIVKADAYGHGAYRNGNSDSWSSQCR